MTRSDYRLQNKRLKLTGIIYFLILFSFLIVIFFTLYRGAGLFRTRLEKESQMQSISELWSLGNYESVVNLTSARLETNPFDSNSLMYAGYSHFFLAISRVSAQKRNVDLDLSVYYLRQLKAIPDVQPLAQIHYILGKVYLLKGRYWADLALKYLKLAYDNGNRSSDILEYIGKAYSELGELDAAFLWYNQAAEDHPTARMFIALGNVAFQLGYYNEAAEYYRSSINITNDDKLKKSGLSQLAQLYYDVENYTLAVESLKLLVDMEPRNVDYWFRLGESYFALGKKPEARSSWFAVTRLNPRHVGALKRLYN